MFTLSKYNIAITTLAFSVWFFLFPYIVWGKTYLYIIVLIMSIITTYFYIHNKYFKIDTLLFIFLITILVFTFNLLNNASIVWSIVVSFMFLLVLLFTKDDIKNIFYKFKFIFAISLIPSMIIWILHIIGVDINIFSIGTLEAPNPLKTEAGQFYILFPGTSILNYMLDSPIIRLQGMYNEPGVVGTIAGLILVSEKMNLKNRSNIIIFIAGIMSLSLAFFITMLLYAFFTLKKNIYQVISFLLFLFVIYNFLPTTIQSQIKARTIERIELDKNFKMKGYNRENKYSNNWENWINSDTESFLFGIDYVSDGSSSWKNILIKSGYIGFFLIIIIYMLLLFINLKKINYDQFIFLFLFFLLFIQRPSIISPVYLLIFIYAAENLKPVNKTLLIPKLIIGNKNE